MRSIGTEQRQRANLSLAFALHECALEHEFRSHIDHGLRDCLGGNALMLSAHDLTNSSADFVPTQEIDAARASVDQCFRGLPRCFVDEHFEAFGGRLHGAARHPAGRVEIRMASTRSVSPCVRSISAHEALTRRDSFKKVLKLVRQWVVLGTGVSMESPRRAFSLGLMGTFRLSTPDGVRVEIASAKGMALIAMLAVTKDGERSRGWLQERLWGSRQREQAQSSLRQELTSLRKCLNRGPKSLLISEHHRVKLDLAQLTVDVHSLGQTVGLPSIGLSVSGEFLEGIDIPGEDGFEEWLRDQRNIFRPIPTTSAGTVATQQPALPQSELLAGQSPLAPRFVDRPSLAVLPFANLTGDSGIDFLCEGLSEDLIDRLSRLRWLPVIARNSSFAFAAGSADIRTIGRQLGARYVLEGRMRAATRDYSIALSLSDATNGLTFWSDRLPVPREQAQDALDPVVANLVGVLDAQIDQAEQLRARGNRQNAVAFNDLIWRGRWHLNRLSRADSEAAGRLFRQAAELEPDSPEALVQVTYQLAWSLWARRAVGDEVVELRRLAHRAMAADPYDGRAYMLAGTAESWMRRPDHARALVDRAIELNPSLSHAHAQVGSISNLTGDPAGAIAPLRMAQRLSPHDNYVFFIIGELAMSYWMLGQWTEAIAEANQALIRRPAYWYAAVIKINSLLGLGDVAAARRALDDLLAVKPDFRPDFIEWTPFVDRKWNQRLREAVERMMGQGVVPLRRRRDSSSGRA